MAQLKIATGDSVSRKSGDNVDNGDNGINAGPELLDIKPAPIVPTLSATREETQKPVRKTRAARCAWTSVKNIMLDCNARKYIQPACDRMHAFVCKSAFAPTPCVLLVYRILSVFFNQRHQQPVRLKDGLQEMDGERHRSSLANDQPCAANVAPPATFSACR